MTGDLGALLAEARRTAWVGRRIVFEPEIESTNDRARALAQEGAPAGTVVLADLQTAGRGRQGRRWEAPRGSSILMSLLLRPQWPVARAPWLVMLAGLAAAEAMERVAGLAVGLKWPNDLVCGAPARMRKLGGLLLESESAGESLVLAVLGIGINVNIAAGALPRGLIAPTSLLVETGAPQDRVALLAALLADLEQWYGRADGGESPHEAWNTRLVGMERPVQVTRGGEEPLAGIAVGVDAWGRFLVRDRRGQTHAIAAGDVVYR